ncbi:MAG TPA: DNA polymerase III subunit gamma/tau, partial [Pseudonocardiaceae bacterium]|nr:DNA polymerase III subunit gamma/tau [Pseudonocardiaceae bacterium]
AEITHNGLTEMRGATAPRLLLELLCARMLLPAATEGDGAVLHRLERLERRLTIAAPQVGTAPPTRSAEVADVAPTSPAGRPEPPSRSAPPAQPPVTQPPVTQAPDPDVQCDAVAEQLDAAAVRRVWPALLDAVRGQSRTTQVLLSNATASAVQGSTLVLILPNAPLARRLGDDRNVELIKAALRTVLGVDWQVRCEHADGDTSPRGAQSPRTSPPQRPPSRRSTAQQPSDAGALPPPEPPDLEEALPQAPVDDDKALLAEASSMSREQPSRRDPEEIAVELLAEQLGARRIDKR